MKNLKNNKGNSFIIKPLIFVSTFLLFTFFLDFTFYGAQYLSVNWLATNLAHKIALQGGLIGTGASHKDASIYVSRVSNMEIIQEADKLLSKFGVAPNQWKLTVNGADVYDKGEPNYALVNTIPYGRTVEVKLKSVYNWRFCGKLFFFTKSFVPSRGTAMSELF